MDKGSQGKEKKEPKPYRPWHDLFRYDSKWERTVAKELDKIKKNKINGYFGKLDFSKSSQQPVYLRFSDKANMIITNHRLAEYGTFPNSFGNYQLSFWTDEKPGK